MFSHLKQYNFIGYNLFEVELWCITPLNTQLDKPQNGPPVGSDVDVPVILVFFESIVTVKSDFTSTLPLSSNTIDALAVTIEILSSTIDMDLSLYRILINSSTLFLVYK